MISLIFEACIVLAAWITLRARPRAVRKLIRAVFARRRRATRKPNKTGNLQPATPGSREASKQDAALAFGIHEFQKTQSFFAITFHSAALVGLTLNPKALGASTLEALTLATKTLAAIAALQLASISFGQYLVLKSKGSAKASSVYLTVLTLIAAIVTLATWIVCIRPLRMRMLDNSPQAAFPCGGFLPTRFCSGDIPVSFYKHYWPSAYVTTVLYDGTYNGTLNHVIAISSLLLLFGFILKQATKWLSELSSGHDWPRKVHTRLQNFRSEHRLGKTSSRSSRIWYMLIRWIPAAILEIWLVVSVSVTLAQVTWIYVLITPVTGLWTIGQIISVALWIPPLFEYMDASIRKLRHSNRSYWR